MRILDHHKQIWQCLAGLGLLMAAISPMELAAQTRTLTESWRWTRFPVESGLSSGPVYDVVETRDGIAWAATANGLAWFDGFLWHPVGRSDSLPEGRPTSLSADGAGGIWVVIHYRLYRGDTSGFRGLPAVVQGVERSVFEAVPLDSGSALLVVVDETETPRLFRYQDGQLRPTEAPSPLIGTQYPSLWGPQSVNHRIWLQLWLSLRGSLNHLNWCYLLSPGHELTPCLWD